MAYPALLRQPAWVLQSASADRPEPTQLLAEPSPEALRSWAQIEPGWRALEAGDRATAETLWRQALAQAPADLLLQRVVNQHAPQLLSCGKPSHRGAPWGSRIALVLPGQLRCLNRSLPLLRALARHADLFVCTSAAYAGSASKLPGAMRVIDPEPTLPMGAMQQWHKLAVALAMVREQEARSGRRYSHILKLRSDFHHVQPRQLLAELVAADGLICASDKVFGGRRELMLLFEGFYPAIAGWFDGQEQRYWPIHAGQILRSDLSAKWYGMAFPQELVGQPTTVEALRAVLAAGGEALAQTLLGWRPPPGADLNTVSCRFFQGHPHFASEVCFARFLNLNAIPARSSPGLLGFLRSDRLQP
ncbi:hypothetical protein KBY70_10180 [Cyanobium sp. ATX 6E8]|nr:hypothetical protein [Cyanobium sp. ATX 6E8]